jgi:hypothetical protein
MVVAVAGVMATAAACDPCFGTSACEDEPAVSLSGRVIEHATGLAVPGTRVSLVWRTRSTSLDYDSVVTISAADGSFRVRAVVSAAGVVRGRLVVTPPAPRPPYTVENFVVPTTNVRGDGFYIGDLVVDPYFLFVGEVHDRFTGALVPYADVQFGRTGGVGVTPTSWGQTADGGGRVFRELQMSGLGTLHALATVTGAGYPRPFQIPVHLEPKYLDSPSREVKVLILGRGLPEFADVRRRGHDAFVPGVTLKFRRTGGIAVTPDSFTLAIPSSGVVAMNLRAQGDGVLLGEFTVTPPAPFKTEVFSNVAMPTKDGDSVRFLRMGFGAQVAARAHFRYRANDQPVEGGVNATLVRRSGQAIHFDGVLVTLDSTGTLSYTSATADTGSTVADLLVRLRAPFDFDTIPGVVLAGRYDSTYTDLGVVRVGRWLPWNGTVVDNTTGAPIAGAQVEFRRVSGIPIAPSPYSTTTNALGTFAIRAVPLRNGDVLGDLAISFGGTFRDTIIPGVLLATSTDDTVRTLPVLRALRISP